MATLICRWCRNENVKALGENVQCFDCGRLAEFLTYAPDEDAPDQTPEEAEEAAALAAEIEAEEAAAAKAKEIPGLTSTSSLNAPPEEEVAVAPLPADSPVVKAARGKKT